MSVKNNTHGFTLMEIMLVVIAIGILAAFALPNFEKAIKKAHIRDAYAQLSAIHGANKIYYAQNGSYFPTATADIDALNTGLGINIIPNGIDYSYDTEDGTEFTATAVWPGSDSFTMVVSFQSLTTGNPCCTVGDCMGLVSATCSF